MKESLLVGSKTRAALKAHGVNVGGDSLDALNEVVHWYIDQAAKRAAANRRKTVRGHDFIIFDAEAAAEPPAPAVAAEGEAETAYAGSDSAASPVADAGEEVQEAADEAPSPTWEG